MENLIKMKTMKKATMMTTTNIRKLTNHKWLNLFNATKLDKTGTPLNWIYASRKDDQTLESKERADAVVIVPIIRKRIDTPLGYYDCYHLIMTSEYRVPIMDRELGFPAGLIDGDEDPVETAKRELKEETGLDLKEVIHVSPVTYSSAGITDEAIIYVFCEADGDLTIDNCEASEDIEIKVITDKDLKDDISKMGKFGAKAYPIVLFAKCYGIINLFDLKNR